MAQDPETLEGRVRAALARGGSVVVLTGAGISAESGIPTFRGRDGYWTVGSRHYAPQEIATVAMFEREPEIVWRWYLYRRGICLAATPNAAHRALVDLELALGDRFTLLTQNVDGLHLRAGSSAARTLHVHGTLHAMRCARGCAPGPVAVPESLPAREAGEPLDASEKAALACPRCSGWMRPHVLWFDETYNEPYYRSESALRAAGQAALLVVVGTSGATYLPGVVAAVAARAGALVVDIDPHENVFAELALGTGGAHVRTTAVAGVPRIAAACLGA